MISDNLAMAIYPSTSERKFSEVKKYRDGFEDKIIISFELFNKKCEHIGWSASGGGISKVAMDCKKWAWDIKHKVIRSGLAEFGGWANFVDDNVSFVSMDIPLTEQEAIFKACEWLLK